MLTAQGKFKFDFFFITNQNCRFLIECNKQNHKEFLQTLSMYKLRSKVEIKIDQKLKIVLSKNKINNDDLEIADEIISFSDPRFDSFFSRSYLNENQIKKN